MKNLNASVEKIISKKKAGEIIFAVDFRGKHPEGPIRKVLTVLSEEGKIRRLGHDIYYKPKMDPLFGELRPGPEEIVQKIAEREKIKIRPASAYAVHRLGLITQVPTMLVYVTDGSARVFKIGEAKIKFKPTTPKKLATKGEISSLVIQALEDIGTDIDPVTERKIQDLLKKEDPKKLQHDLKLATAKVYNYIIQLTNKPVVS
jgi:hypothetical protein